MWGQIIGAIAGTIANIFLPGSGVIVYSAVSSAITASMNGASFGEALGIGAISGFTAWAGGNAGQAFGKALSLSKFATNILAGAMGGAAGGAAGAAVGGGGVLRAMGAGAAGGAIGMAIPGVGPIIGGGVASEIAGGDFWEGAAGGTAYVISAAIAAGAIQTARDINTSSRDGLPAASKMSSSLEKLHRVDMQIATQCTSPSSADPADKYLEPSRWLSLVSKEAAAADMPKIARALSVASNALNSSGNGEYYGAVVGAAIGGRLGFVIGAVLIPYGGGPSGMLLGAYVGGVVGGYLGKKFDFEGAGYAY